MSKSLTFCVNQEKAPRFVAGLCGLVLIGVVANVTNIFASGIFNWMALAMTFALLIWYCQFLGLTRSDLGLRRSTIRSGLRDGGLAVVLILCVLLVAYLLWPGLFVDSRYEGRSLGDVLRLVLVRIPLHTVAFEELFFRGAVLGYGLKHLSQRWAIGVSSALFGLWHILPSLGIASSSQTIASTVGTNGQAHVISILGVVFATAIAGIVFSQLRIRSKSLLAPSLAHWAINSSAVIFAALATR